MMTKKVSFALALALMLSVLAGSAAAAEDAKPAEAGAPPADTAVAVEDETTEQKAAWCLGYNFGRRVQDMVGDLDAKVFLEGFQKGLSGQKSRFTRDETMDIIQKYQLTEADRQTKRKAARLAMVAPNLKASKEFMAKNGKREGVKTTASGLQYEVVKDGKGDSPKADSSATVHYTGSFVDGAVFDSSVVRGEPAVFRVDRVIAGWTEALQFMKPGGKLKLYIPPDLGYGEKGKGEDILPNVVLIFEVELISFDYRH